MALDWDPKRRGAIYCSSACGGRCTWEAYTAAKKEAAVLSKSLGEGWLPYVWENLGWHFQVENKALSLTISKAGDSFMASLWGGHWSGFAKSPQAAIKQVAKTAAKDLPGLRGVIACVEGVNRSFATRRKQK